MRELEKRREEEENFLHDRIYYWHKVRYELCSQNDISMIHMLNRQKEIIDIFKKESDDRYEDSISKIKKKYGNINDEIEELYNKKR